MQMPINACHIEALGVQLKSLCDEGAESLTSPTVHIYSDSYVISRKIIGKHEEFPLRALDLLLRGLFQWPKRSCSFFAGYRALGSRGKKLGTGPRAAKSTSSMDSEGV